MIINHIITNMITIETIKQRLIEAIKQSPLSQKEIAEKLAVSPSCVSHYVAGDILPSLDTLANLCVILDISPAYILGIEKA